MNPPYEITSEILHLTANITELLGQLSSLSIIKPEPKLRKQNRIKTIKSSLAIEGNTFTEEQITAILDGKKVLGPKKEIIEVKNAIQLYDKLPIFDPYNLKSVLKAHAILMNDLVVTAGMWRNKNVGVLDGTKVKHIAPKPDLVPKLMNDLFLWLKKDTTTHYLLKGAIVHYEIEFIHPFEDGNGRMGRFWQTLLLAKNNPIFEYLPIESLIEKKQKEYYQVLEKCDKAGKSTLFIEFMLSIIKDTLSQYIGETKHTIITEENRLEKAKTIFKTRSFSRKDYMLVFKTISPATASRDLKSAVDKKILRKTGDKNNTIYRFTLSAAPT
jgi:Fic family protein